MRTRWGLGHWTIPAGLLALLAIAAGVTLWNRFRTRPGPPFPPDSGESIESTGPVPLFRLEQPGPVVFLLRPYYTGEGRTGFTEQTLAPYLGDPGNPPGLWLLTILNCSPDQEWEWDPRRDRLGLEPGPGGPSENVPVSELLAARKDPPPAGVVSVLDVLAPDRRPVRLPPLTTLRLMVAFPRPVPFGQVRGVSLIRDRQAVAGFARGEVTRDEWERLLARPDREQALAPLKSGAGPER
jgi:hypothetical protein